MATLSCLRPDINRTTVRDDFHKVLVKGITWRTIEHKYNIYVAFWFKYISQTSQNIPGLKGAETQNAIAEKTKIL